MAHISSTTRTVQTYVKDNIIKLQTA